MSGGSCPPYNLKSPDVRLSTDSRENSWSVAFGRDNDSVCSGVGALSLARASSFDGGGELKKESSSSVPIFSRIGQRQLLLKSYAALRLLSHGSLSVNVGLFARLGMAYGVPSTATTTTTTTTSPMPSPLFFGLPFLTASDVLQLECIWGRMQWATSFNILCFSLPFAKFPVCELVCTTPRTDWLLQADRLLFKFNGFCRVFVRNGRRRFDSLISSNSPAEPLCVSSDNAGGGDSDGDGHAEKAEKTAGKVAEEKTSSLPTKSSASTAISPTRSIRVWTSSSSSIAVAEKSGGWAKKKN